MTTPSGTPDEPAPTGAAAANPAGSDHELRQARTGDEIEAARQLFREYQEWSGEELCFQGFAAELASLPGVYAPPQGRLLLAARGAEIAGCVALRPLSPERCEMKRLYVRPSHQGLGLGRRLVVELLDQARAIGYRSIVLDTLPQMTSAQRLYGSLGFRDIAPYYHNPIPGARYLELVLDGGAR